jgi:hypothetical protein
VALEELRHLRIALEALDLPLHQLDRFLLKSVSVLKAGDEDLL